MGKPLAIPGFLAINWWWLLVLAAVEGTITHWLRAPDWLPSVTCIWWFGQPIWLKLAEPRSRAVYFYTVAGAYGYIFDLLPGILTKNQWIQGGIGVIGLALFIVSIFVFASELDHHFNEVDRRGLRLSRVMVFFFNSLYFQYWFHQLHVEQNEPEMRVTPGPA